MFAAAIGRTMAHERILLVEDEFLVRLTLAEALTDEGFDVVEAGSGDEALAVFERDTTIRILLTDIQLPGSMNGYHLAKRLREQRPDLPVIYMTGRPDAATTEGARPRTRLIVKPYLPSEICDAVRRLLDESA